MSVLDRIAAARRVSAPVLAISTPDMVELTKAIAAMPREKAMEGPRFAWDVLRGLVALDDMAGDALRRMGLTSAEQAAQETANPAAMLEKLLLLPGWHQPATREGGEPTQGGSMVVAMNIQPFLYGPLANAQVIQGVINLRDAFKKNKRTLVMLAPEVTLPSALINEALIYHEPLPTDEQSKAKLRMLYSVVRPPIPAPDEAFENRAADAVRGLSLWGVEQAYATSMDKDGLDLAECWSRKEAAINQTRGLTITRGGPRFEDIAGLESVKQYFTDRFACEPEMRPRVIVFVDEINDAMAGVRGDNTGVAQDAHGVLLQWMEDKEQDGAIFVGAPGSGKTMLARSLASLLDGPMIAFDLGAMKGSLVGESEQNIRHALRIIDGIAGTGGAFVVATCNQMDNLPPQFVRRFTSGVWFFDLPTAEEREAAWRVHLQGFGLPLDSERPAHDGWTPAEIRNCCKKARQLRRSPKECARYIVPVALSDKRGLGRLRDLADGSFLSASYPGPYRKARIVEAEDAPERALVVNVTEVELPRSAAEKGKGN